MAFDGNVSPCVGACTGGEGGKNWGRQNTHIRRRNILLLGKKWVRMGGKLNEETTLNLGTRKFFTVDRDSEVKLGMESPYSIVKN